MGTTGSQMEMPVQRAKLNCAITVATLQHEGQRLGYVLVFEDLSDLLRAQKQAAWREVARRVAHEIKNPLTPIALSAERIRRHLERGMPPDTASLQVIHGCADTIAGAVETVRTLVDEFSTLARFPTAQPQPASINAIIERALVAPQRPNHRAGRPVDLVHRPGVAQRHDQAAVGVERDRVEVIGVEHEPPRGGLEERLGDRDMVEITVADSGHGVTQELKEKLFLPYFSTKKRGTGLGLAIVSRIIEDHHGSIRVEENKPVGSRFIVELPIAPEPISSPTVPQHA